MSSAHPHKSRPLQAPRPMPTLYRRVTVIWWQGIALGCVIGGGLVYVALHTAGLIAP